jgi:hypothetical protein
VRLQFESFLKKGFQHFGYVIVCLLGRDHSQNVEAFGTQPVRPNDLARLHTFCIGDQVQQRKALVRETSFSAFLFSTLLRTLVRPNSTGGEGLMAATSKAIWPPETRSMTQIHRMLV